VSSGLFCAGQLDLVFVLVVTVGISLIFSMACDMTVLFLPIQKFIFKMADTDGTGESGRIKRTRP
jgi:hypothetical protein